MSSNIILGIDPGVGSIGLFKRDTNKSDLSEQLIGGTILTFPSGVTDSDKTISLATERGDKRRQRNHILSRKQCKWATLELLIDLGMCPLSLDELDKWRKYDKNAEIKHPYPTSKQFRAWLMCDFNNDGTPDFTMFELRYILAINDDIDLSTPTGKHMLGRVIYHMANHRGFRSSKGDRANIDQENRGVEDDLDFKGAEEEKAKEIKQVMSDYNLPTIGCALYHLNYKGERIRESKYTIIAKQNKEELKYIFDLHKELGENRINLCKSIIKVVFKVKPLKSQKGNVGFCAFEKNKHRAPKSRPEFEIYRAWSFINNIRYSDTNTSCNNQELPLDTKQKLFSQNFWGKETFEFEKISEFLRKEFGNKNINFNYEDELTVSGCPILFLLKSENFLGNNWSEISIPIGRKRTNRKQQQSHLVVHNWETIWNKCYTGDVDDINDFCTNKIKRQDWIKPMIKLMKHITKADGYTHLSTYALKKINNFLCQGIQLDKAVLLAKIPDIIGQNIWSQNKDIIINEISAIRLQVENKRLIARIVNNLINAYKQICIIHENAYAYKDYEYVLKDDDIENVNKAVEEFIDKNDVRYSIIFNEVKQKYQEFFYDPKRTFIKPVSFRDEVIEFLTNNFDCDTSKLYNHSLIEKYTYTPLEITNNNGEKVRLLGNPQLHNLKNPVVLRTMYKLRNILNYMLETGQISNESRLVVETAKDFNDANMRWAIEQYQQIKEEENKNIETIVSEIFKETRNVTTNDIKIARYAYEQSLLREGNENNSEILNPILDLKKKEISNRYKLWKEQNFKCIYTGKIISLSDVLNGDNIDIEHTLPLSKSMDDSDENKTLCESWYNRNIKKNKMPSELENDYEEILKNIKPWIDKVDALRKKVLGFKKRAKNAQDKASKDTAIRLMHLYQLEYNYWNGKVSRFQMKKIDNAFVNRQLSDTRTITRYLVEYLRVVFPNVSVQNSHITTAFREMLGLPKKSRENNLHHAQDAAILSMIPSAVIRDKLLKLYFEIKEIEKWKDDSKIDKLQELKKELHQVKIHAQIDQENIHNIVEQKINEIIVNNLTTNRAFNTTRRKYRKRGKVVPLRDDNGNVVYDTQGNVIPYRWHQGSSVRGELCKDTFYGAIKRSQKDKNGKVIQVIKYVKREKINKLDTLKSSIKSDELVDKKLQSYLKEQTDNMTTEQFSEHGIVDFQGNKIRHIRCFTSNGVIPIKKQTNYISKHVYKNNIYCENSTNVFYVIYENHKGERIFDVSNLLWVSLNRTNNHTKDSLFPLHNNGYVRKYVLQVGTRVILQKDKDENIKELKRADFIKRLYIINNFEKDGRIKMCSHRKNKGCEKFVSKVSFDQEQEGLRLSKTNLNFWVEGYDFEILPDGEIKIL